MTAMLAHDFFERHASKIARAGPDECWIWTAAHRNGYGAVDVCGRARRAHRAAFEATNGEGSADGLVVRHRCDVPLCVNPAHLEVGTHADNVRDRDERGRRAATKGEANGCAKLTDDEVRTIRAIYVRGSGDLGQSALARRYGVARQLISLIVNRKLWAHVA